VQADSITIRSVSIENFRGFRDEQTIDLAASATVISGSNGKGKTSFFDALQWLLLGSLDRLANLATRRSDDYIVNRFAGSGAVATVRAELELNGRAVTITRSGAQKASTLNWIDASQTRIADDATQALCEALLADPDASLKDTVLTSGVLQQDVIRAVLEDEPKDRYRNMAALLGLEELAGFEDEVKSRASERDKLAGRARDEYSAGERQLRASEADLARLEERLASQPEIAKVRDELESEAKEKVTSFDIRELPSQAAEAVVLGQMARNVRLTADRLLSGQAGLRTRQTSVQNVDPRQLPRVVEAEARVSKDREAARKALELALKQQHDGERRAGQIGELAAHAIPLLGDHCPVCKQQIDAASVESHLRELLDGRGRDLPALIAETEAAQARVAVFDDELEKLLRERADLEAAAVNELNAARDAWLDQCAELAQSSRIQASEQTALVAGDTAALENLRVSADRLASISDRLATLLGTTGLGEEVERRRQNVNELRDAVKASSEEASRASQEAERAKTLASAATRAAAGVTRDRFSRLEPLINNVFARLAPHPAFTTLGFRIKDAYRSGVADPFVTDPQSGISGDPLLVFSSSQSNVAALTYFLALSWAADAKGLPFLLLDDPLQSMDDVNALGFSDLCRHLRLRRQLVISTHEERLASLLERKLAPRSPGMRTRVVRFVGWDRGGPTIEQVDVEPESVGQLLEAG
jgi:DNA repair exonuclease SbcCD ATPase subunit